VSVLKHPEGYAGVAPLDGVALHYQVSGSGPAIVLLHGSSFDHRMWDEQVGTLAERFSVVRYDLRGFGRSSPSSAPYSHARDLQALIEYLELDRPILVGLSLGGSTVLNHAVLYPGVARALVVVGPSLGGFAYSQEFMSTLMALRVAAEEGGLDAARNGWLASRVFDGARPHPALFARLTAMVNDYSGWHWTNPDPGVPVSPPTIEQLPSIDVPTLVIIGRHDSDDFQRIATTVESAVPRSRRVVIEDAGHLVNMERPEDFNRVLNAFLDELPIVQPDTQPNA
jgi:3-oxoadipate enol-lactonase